MEITSHFISTTAGITLHLRQFCGHPEGAPLLLLHGAIEDGRIFYSASGRGLAPYLAQCGFDVYVADLRGHGGSQPAVGSGDCYGQTEAIVEDIPTFSAFIALRRQGRPQHWIAHSWGGVLFSSVLARFPEYRSSVLSLVYFGSKRTVQVWNLQRLLQVELIWKGLCPLIAKIAGYLPARGMRIGSANETTPYLLQCLAWVRRGPWIDPVDGYDYGRAARAAALPPTWYLAAIRDRCLGHPRDVYDFMTEAGEQPRCYTILSRRNGNGHDYDHISMLTHPSAVDDHFPQVVEWLQGHEATAIFQERDKRQEEKGRVNHG